MPQVNYAVAYSSLTVTDAEYDLVYTLYRMHEPLKVTAVKFIRNQYRLGLREAKDVCDVIGSAPRPPAE